MARPGAGFVARDRGAARGIRRTVHKLTLTVKERETEVAPGVTQQLWTYNGTAPGPTLRGKVGDMFDITLVNDGTIGHSIDFHAGALAPDSPCEPSHPGQSLDLPVHRHEVRHLALPLLDHADVCSISPTACSAPSSSTRPAWRRSTRNTSSCSPSSTSAPTGRPGRRWPGCRPSSPTLVVFNGYTEPVPRTDRSTATAGEQVRIWVLDAGPNRGSAFHIVGAQFDTVFREGDYR